MESKRTWQSFYEAAILFRDLKPWEWLYDSHIFGIEDPETGEIDYCCIMGNAGEVFALGLYLGAEGFQSYGRVFMAAEEFTLADQAALALQQFMLKVEYVNREEVTKPDRDQYEELGLKFRGKHQWIVAREHQPGYLPWYISEDQARKLTNALRQAVDVALRAEDDPVILEQYEDQLLVRRCKKTPGGLDWRDEYQKTPSVFLRFGDWGVSSARVKKARKDLKKVPAALLLIFQYMHTPIQEGGRLDRPFFPRLLIWINYADGMIMGYDMLGPDEGGEAFEEKVFQQIHRLGIIPEQIGVNTVMGLQALNPITEALDIELLYLPEEPLFEEVLAVMGKF